MYLYLLAPYFQSSLNAGINWLNRLTAFNLFDDTSYYAEMSSNGVVMKRGSRYAVIDFASMYSLSRHVDVKPQNGNEAKLNRKVSWVVRVLVVPVSTIEVVYGQENVLGSLA